MKPDPVYSGTVSELLEYLSKDQSFKLYYFFFDLMIAISIYVIPTNVKLFASKFPAKKLGGPVGA